MKSKGIRIQNQLQKISQKHIQQSGYLDGMTKKQVKNRQDYINFLRGKFQLKHKYQYIFPSISNYKPRFEKIELFGQSHPLIGSQNLLENSQFVLAVLEEYKPKSCILGGMNVQDLQEMNQQIQIYSQTPNFKEDYNDILAKKRMIQFFEEEINKNPLYFKIEDDKIFYRNDPVNKVCHMENYLSAANLYSLSPDRYLLFGKPSQHLLFEDIALRLDLQQLRDIFNHVISYVYQGIENGDVISGDFENYKMLAYIRKAAKKLYGNVLFEKQLLYQASLFKKSAKLFKTTGMVIDDEFLEESKKLIKENYLPDMDMIFRQYIKNEEVEKKMKNRYVERMKKANKLFRDDEDREKIKKILEEQNSVYDFKSKEKFYYDGIQRQNVEEIVEKYGINQSDQIDAVNAILRGDITENSLHIYYKLMLEANMELGGIIKFPKKFQRYLGYLTNIQKTEILKKFNEKVNKLEKYNKILITSKNEEEQVEQLKKSKEFKEILQDQIKLEEIIENKGQFSYQSEIQIQSEKEQQLKYLQKEAENGIKNEGQKKKKDNISFYRPDDIEDSNNMYFSLGQDKLPFEFENKSVEELLELGMEDVSGQDAQFDQFGRLQGESGMDEEEKAKIESMLQQIMKEEREKESDK
ncbi:hypothetical protein PPERSA_11530 [Pseudocohnilembus persalinus]|uniref:Uncharacterized protein n=1 Tax=Pseudocohnilembus persalinus TaxID=266149 RepID=A0A0V0QYC5_PSEPJ|nr:hypothetical protein PPERSA_11530 [Pseudocohnilembus persalinus]|eukprot:KRX06885.1 hypothetical protein PPERSA_11530 [Pseudocohnilembus persalinus]